MEMEYFKAAILDAIIPENTTAELAELLEESSNVQDDVGRLIPVRERDFLLFGMSAYTFLDSSLTHL